MINLPHNRAGIKVQYYDFLKRKVEITGRWKVINTDEHILLYVECIDPFHCTLFRSEDDISYVIEYPVNADQWSQ